ncbi:alpha-mannosidase [Oceaniglobus trochenteri]|uniref:alpha-mannosidase n=1 Tax=Oceaniglobus trochenteri TaxID=2763260 RepID=UPI001CFFDBA7|nr:glycoside hydrolase family 38 C-terminal domain-containing protein [Oceaniglobus trochenteri]
MNHQLRFTAEKIGKRIDLIRPLILRARHPLPEFDLEELFDATAKPGTGTPRGAVAWDSYWAGQNTHFVLRSRFDVPKDYTNPALYLPLGVAGDIFTHPEALLHIDGRALASADRHHQLIALDPALADGTEHELMLQGWTGLTGWPPDPKNPDRLQIRPCHVVDVDPDLRDFLVLAEVALDVATSRDPGDRLRDRMLQALDVAFVTLDTRDPLGDALRASVPDAHAGLKTSLAEIAPPDPEILHAVGHAHMDIAYLWPVDQIRQKNARTSSNVLRLMEQDKGFCFSHSQPQLYDYTKQDFPEIFEAIKARVAEGRWEVMGGMWVESDCNIPGGEALVRQILLGRTYFRDTFGDVETPVLWLPDTFGFPWSLPQLMKLSGLEYFVTNKLNWNQYNRMPSSTIWWQGLDGSRVLAQFLTTPREVQHLPFPTNYKSDLSAAEVIGTVTNATSGPDVNNFLIAYGYGDGGGGPSEELILKSRAYEAMPGAPKVQMGRIGPALEAIREQSDRLPTWNDELYLEGHRGTLTSQAWIKRANRLAERALHDTEAAVVLAWPDGAPQEIRERLKTAWRTVCLNQFHDILTGTSIPVVFEDARRDYAAVQADTSALRDMAFARLSGGQGTSLFNPAPVASAPVTFLPGSDEGQSVEGGSLVAAGSLAAYGLVPLSQADIPPPPVTLTREGDDFILANSLLRLTISRDGALTGLYHLPTGREALAPGETGNQFWAFEDRPLSWDAWDIDVFHEDRSQRIDGTAEIEIVEDGPLRAALRINCTYRDSHITQDIRLTAGSPRVDFVTEIDWAEQHTLLKVAFPVNIHQSRATYDIQWGEIERPTHRNTTWDYARFEVPAQKWADLGEGGFGVALLNDCKYGYDIRDNVIRLTLVKSSTSPDPGADQGRHRFTYALMPHAGDRADVRAEARRLNDPVIVLPGVTDRQPLVSCGAENVIMETLKPAEDGRGFILRLYEADRRRGPVRLVFGRAMQSVTVCDLLENDMSTLELDQNNVTLTLKPFEILSLRCLPEIAGGVS